MNFLVAGYLVIWTALFFYLFFLHRRQQNLNRKLKSLAQRVERE